MSDLTYTGFAAREDKVLVWQGGEIHTPPVSLECRREMGVLLRQLQQGVLLELPRSRPLPIVGVRCHELRVTDKNAIWRIIYRLEPDAIVILEVFQKKTQTTPRQTIAQCRARLSRYLRVIK
jgi:phage-related protein